MESQNKQILAHLRAGKTITAIQALNKYGVFRLASRINDLKNGYLLPEESIVSERIRVNKKFIAIYSLKTTKA